MKRYAANDFTERRRPTIGADFMTKEIIAGDQPMLLQVTATGALSEFPRVMLLLRCISFTSRRLRYTSARILVVHDPVQLPSPLAGPEVRS